MDFIKKEHKRFSKKDYKSFILGADIGGTNANFGIFGVKNNFPKLLVSYHFESKKLKGIYSAINKVLGDAKTDYGVNITKACFGVAGAVSPKRDFVRLTNAELDLSTKKLLAKTKLRKAALVNDFEAVGYGINLLSKNDVRTIKRAKKMPKAPIVIVGAGTGLGKTTLIYDEHYKAYIPINSEAGHSDFAVQTLQELELINFIKKYKKINKVNYEEILSGRGLVNIYSFLRKNKGFKQTKYTKVIDKSKNKPELISKYKKIDKTCKTAFEIFKTAYANFAKNMALDALAFGGVYITGGIAPKNMEIFDNEFVNIFECSPKMGYVLKKMPIYLILNYDVGLLGAGFFGARQK
ncbi:glucokinase [Candidatus Woesearchaeota archaeon]|nr:glucokinase [Candidatus Woesearchaeota archaeon]